MIYINSKQIQQDVTSLNSFQLDGAFKKAERLLNHLSGSNDSEKEILIRYVSIIRLNLWREIERRTKK